jgi:uncharacterized protein
MAGVPGPTEWTARLPLEEKVRFLALAAHHPHRTSRVEVVETHFAFVFLTDDFAYKMKKPVRLPLMDFTTLEGRYRDCLDELRLNRRLAEDVYIDVVPLTLGDNHQLALNGEGEVLEWLVWMRRLPGDGMLDRVISPGHPDPEVLRPAAEHLAGFYRDALPLPPPQLSSRERFHRDVEVTADQLCDPRFGLPVRRIRELEADHLSFLEQRGFLLDRRDGEGRIVEGHGDLRPEHIYLGPPPAVIDCLEFDRDLRTLDPADDLSFLWLECERLGNAPAGAFFLQVYGQVTGDHPPGELLRFYRSFRALIRAALAIRHLRDEGETDDHRWRSQALTYLALSRRHLPSG